MGAWARTNDEREVDGTSARPGSWIRSWTSAAKNEAEGFFFPFLLYELMPSIYQFSK